MRLHNEPKTIVKSGTSGESKFKIKMNGKAYEVLSSGLYTDSIRAIVRELSCNAYDAHVAAGKADQPFEIHLPNSMEPFFYVKDFGIGLSDDEIRGREVTKFDDDGNEYTEREGGLYITYFDSTKTGSDDFIGALGLGSKSPLSYTDSFQVTSRYNGTRRLYNVFLNEDGEPSVVLLTEDLTDECNGLEVRLAIKSGDFWLFRAKVATALMWFPVKPTVVGHSGDFEFQKQPDHSITGTNWYASTKQGYGDGDFTAVMANVQYRVNISHLVDHITPEALALIKSVNIVAHFQNGELDFVASREELKYKERTINALVKRCNEIREYFVQSVEQMVATEVKGTTYWEQHQQIKAISKRLLNSDWGLADLIKGYTQHPTLLKYLASKATSGFTVSSPAYVISKFTPRYKGGVQILAKDGNSSWNGTSYEKLSIEPRNTTLVVIDDVRVGSQKRLREYVKTNPMGLVNQQVVTIKKVTPKQASHIPNYPDLTGVDYAAELHHILDTLGNPPTVTLTVVTAKQVTKTASGYARGPLTAYQFGSRSRRGNIEWNTVSIAPDKEKAGGLFMRVSGISHDVTNHKDEEFNRNYSAMSNALESMIAIVNKVNKTSYTIKDLYGIGPRAIKDISKNKKWIDLFAFAAKHVDKFTSIIKPYENIGATNAAYGFTELMGAGENGSIHRYGKGLDANGKKVIALIKGLDKTSPFREKFMPLIEAVELIDDQADFARKVSWYGQYVDQSLMKGGKGLVSTGSLEATYPMLTFVGRISYHSLDKFFDYIKLIDRS